MYSLDKAQVDTICKEFEEVGFAKLPIRLSKDTVDSLNIEIDAEVQKEKENNHNAIHFKIDDIVGRNQKIRELVSFKPALQITHKIIKQCFRVCLSNAIHRVFDPNAKQDFSGSSPWHSDGAALKDFPSPNGEIGLRYVKFGFFLSDLSSGEGSSLEVIKGSHKQKELDGVNHTEFDVSKYKNKHVKLNDEVGSVVVFHQALWHAAGQHLLHTPRRTIYIAYSPSWILPYDRGLNDEWAAEKNSSTDLKRYLMDGPDKGIDAWKQPQGHREMFSRDCN
jgi:ectoine hydroxylase-related dioxygenase (phytanoyl-CoA dioxygenase family)